MNEHLHECGSGAAIDRGIGDIVAAARANRTGPKQFAQVRYEPDLAQHGLNVLG